MAPLELYSAIWEFKVQTRTYAATGEAHVLCLFFEWEEQVHENCKGSVRYRPSCSCTCLRIVFSYASRSSRYILQASMLAPLSTFGSASMLSTESKIFSMDCTGDQRSADDSYTVWKRSKSQICPTYCSDHHQRHEEC